MACSTILLACSSVALSWGAPPPLDPDLAEWAQAVRDECLAESGAVAALVAGISAGTDPSPGAALKCYIKCTMVTAGMMNAGAVDVEAIVAMLRADSSRTCARAAPPPGTDQPDVAYNTHVCWQTASKDDYSLI